MSVRLQLTTVAIVVLLFAVVNLVAVLGVVREMDDDARVINLASQLRSLAQRTVTQELLGINSEETRKSVEHSFNVLVAGDAALGIGRQGDATVAAVHDAEARWSSFNEGIQTFHKDPNQRPAMLLSSEAFMEASDRVVASALHESENNVVTVNRNTITLSVLSAILALLIWMVSRRIVSSLAQTVATLVTTSAEIATVIEQQTHFAAQQAATTNETTTAMEELRASSQLSSEQSQSAASHSRQVVQLTQEGSNSVEQTSQGITNLKGKVEGFSQQMLRLSEQVSQIGSITTVVGDLANQTNMLALNAAVEAVRAGDQGRGFSVVAAEILSLADRSRRSAERIGSLVGEIQQATNTTVMVAEQGIRNAEDSTKMAQQAAQKLGGVSTSMTSIYDSVEQISLNARQQAEAVRQVLEAMTAVNAGARQTAGGIAQTREGISQLNHVANTLKVMVGLNTNGTSTRPPAPQEGR